METKDTKQQHTAEPWKVSLSDNATPHILSGGTYDDHSPDQFICVMPAEIIRNFNSFNNARRIVACVNELAGVHEVTGYVHRLEDQRDKLLAVMQKIARGEYVEGEEVSIAIAAIAEIEAAK